MTSQVPRWKFDDFGAVRHVPASIDVYGVGTTHPPWLSGHRHIHASVMPSSQTTSAKLCQPSGKDSADSNISAITFQPAQPTVVIRNTNDGTSASSYSGGGDACPAGRLSGAAASAPAPTGAGNATRAGRCAGAGSAAADQEQRTQRGLTYRVFHNHYLCQRCPNEWSEPSVVAGASYCPACDRATEAYLSEQFEEEEA